MTVQRSQPLPECISCQRPTRRDVHSANGGLCSQCRRLRPAWVPTPEELDLTEWQQLAARRGQEQRDELAARRARRERTNRAR